MREQILDAAQDLVQDRGLDAVSFQDVANAVGLKKPSLFHHFANKNALIIALLERCQSTYGATYRSVLDDSKIDALTKLRKIANLFEEELKSDHRCLLATLAGSHGVLSAELREQLRHTTEATIALYARAFAQGRREGTLHFEGSPKAAATAWLAMLQGLQTLARVQGNPGVFRSAAASHLRRLGERQ